MTKADWLKLAMPASITLLTAAIVATPLLSNAQNIRLTPVTGTEYDPICTVA